MVRNSQSSSPKKKVYLVVEGEVEIDYFNKINELQLFPKLQLICKKGNEKSFPTIYKEHIEHEVFLLLDLDDLRPGYSRYQDIKKLYDSEDYKDSVYISRYSFETWLLNHKKYFATPICTNTEYNTHMKECFSVEHWAKEKNEENRNKVMNSIFEADVNQAIINCKNLYDNSIEPNDFKKNPVSTIYKLMIRLKKLNDKCKNKI